MRKSNVGRLSKYSPTPFLQVSRRTSPYKRYSAAENRRMETETHVNLAAKLSAEQNGATDDPPLLRSN